MLCFKLNIYVYMLGIKNATQFNFQDLAKKLLPAPFRLAKYMSGPCFELLLSHLCFIKEEPPSFVNQFWEVRKMLHELQKHFTELFIPS